tara:strand:+ start:99 stop:539 length:441 start_codon:yes stop_codon:yes gene_type:complete
VSRQKAPNALRTIGEVAEELGVATHVLRFWESKFKQIKPQKRRGRRYYRPEDIKVITQIKALLYGQGYTIRGVQKFLSDGNQALAFGNDNQQAPANTNIFENNTLELTHKASEATPPNRTADAQSAKLKEIHENLQRLKQKIEKDL